ncbi:MAG TPA: hypothetical protein VFZ89_18240 [Solirubrobacteraceae bacterium]
MGPHKELVSFRDPASPQQVWTFDVTFMTSTYRCTWGCGCGDETGVGYCCSHGVELWWDADNREQCAADEARVRARIEDLTDEEWQLRGVAQQRGGAIKTVGDGRPFTRVVDGGCIMNNRAGFAGGAGCALHLAALRRGESPLDWKPRTCWMMPLMREELDDGSYVVRAVLNTDWSGDDEYEPLDWWCIDDAANYAGGPEPVYRTMREELVALCGEAVYTELCAYLDARTPVTAGSLPMAWVGTPATVPPDGSTGRPLGPSLPMARG